MKLIVGLGNPGAAYERTRHNAGFLALDRLAHAHARGQTPRSKFNALLLEAALGEQRCLLLKPLTFMNRSGQSVGEAAAFYKVPAGDVLVLVDDYALPLGSLRLRGSGGSGGHNGLADIQRALGTDAYPRLRIGIDAPAPGYDDPADWVLGKFTDEQLARLSPALDRAARCAETFATRGLDAAMNGFNAGPAAPAVPGVPPGSAPPAGASGVPARPPPPRPSPGPGPGLDPVAEGRGG